MVEATLLKYKSASHSHNDIILILKGKFNMHCIRYSVSHQSNAVEDRWQAIDQLPYHYWQLMSMWLHFINLHFRSLVIKKVALFLHFSSNILEKLPFKIPNSCWRTLKEMSLQDEHNWNVENLNYTRNCWMVSGSLTMRRDRANLPSQDLCCSFYLGNPHWTESVHILLAYDDALVLI